MTQKPYLLFHQTAEQLRRVAARGGRATARNRRARLRTDAPPPPPPGVPPPPPHAETTAAAIAALEAQCPWLSQMGLRPTKGDENRRISPASNLVDALLVEVDRAVEQLRPSGCLIRSVYLTPISVRRGFGLCRS